MLSKGARRRKPDGAIRISSKSIEKYNGVQRFKYGLADAEDRVGVVTGLAWTQVGGELLNIEAVAVSGKGKQIRTGSLGDVMQESIQAALTVVRSRTRVLGNRFKLLLTSTTCTCMFLKALHPRMDRAQELGCARRWCPL